MAMIEEQIKFLIVNATSPCKELQDFLRSSPKSLQWLARKSTTLMLNLAVSFDYTFGSELMNLVFKQWKGNHHQRVVSTRRTLCVSGLVCFQKQGRPVIYYNYPELALGLRKRSHSDSCFLSTNNLLSSRRSPVRPFLIVKSKLTR